MADEQKKGAGRKRSSRGRKQVAPETAPDTAPDELAAAPSDEASAATPKKRAPAKPRKSRSKKRAAAETEIAIPAMVDEVEAPTEEETARRHGDPLRSQVTESGNGVAAAHAASGVSGFRSPKTGEDAESTRQAATMVAPAFTATTWDGETDEVESPPEAP